MYDREKRAIKSDVSLLFRWMIMMRNELQVPGEGKGSANAQQHRYIKPKRPWCCHACFLSSYCNEGVLQATTAGASPSRDLGVSNGMSTPASVHSGEGE